MNFQINLYEAGWNCILFIDALTYSAVPTVNNIIILYCLDVWMVSKFK